MPASNRLGYTLIELVVAVLLLGILTAMAVPHYLLTSEIGKATAAAANVNAIGTANKMFALDHANYYVHGQFPIATGATCSTDCTARAGSPNDSNGCPLSVTTPQPDPCILVCCKYLADQAWGDEANSYYYCALDPGPGYTVAACYNNNGVALAHRNSNATGNDASGYPYNNWAYTMSLGGQIANDSDAPPAAF